MKKFHLYTIIMGIFLLVFLIWKIGIKELLCNFSLLGWGLIPIILLEGVADIFHSFAWKACLPYSLRSIPFSKIFCIKMAGTSINYLTPTLDLGGEVTKGTLLAIDHQGPGIATGIIIDKLSFAFSKLLFVVIGSLTLLWDINLSFGIRIGMFVGSGILGAGILGFLIVQRSGRLGSIVRWLVNHNIGGSLIKKISTHITQIDEELKQFYKENPHNLPISMLWHSLGFMCGIFQCWIFMLVLTGKSSFIIAAGIWLLGTWLDLVGFAIPTHIGVIEAGRVLVFKVMGFGSSLGLTFGLALRIEQLFWAVVGLLIYMWYILKTHNKNRDKEVEKLI